MAIPDRWENYTPIGKPIEGTRIVAFKVPLNKSLCQKIAPEIQLTTDMLLQHLPNLGFIIDLTNTLRYYNPKFFTERGIKHTKIWVPGKTVPSEHMVRDFIRNVEDFLQKNANNDKLIGVHCTHGANRTGYLICRYLMKKLNYAPAVAMQKFIEARGHEISRDYLVNDLHKKAANGIRSVDKSKSSSTKSANSTHASNSNNRRDMMEPMTAWRSNKSSDLIPATIPLLACIPNSLTTNPVSSCNLLNGSNIIQPIQALPPWTPNISSDLMPSWRSDSRDDFMSSTNFMPSWRSVNDSYSKEPTNSKPTWNSEIRNNSRSSADNGRQKRAPYQNIREERESRPRYNNQPNRPYDYPKRSSRFEPADCYVTRRSTNKHSRHGNSYSRDKARSYDHYHRHGSRDSKRDSSRNAGYQ